MSCSPGDINLQSFLPFYHLDDISYKLALYELTRGPVNIDPIRLESLLFNPIDHPKAMHSYLNNVDPDANFPSHRTTSNYMVEESISNQFISKSPNETFSLMHLNARRLICNFDKFEILLANLWKSFSVIRVTEPWLNYLTSDLVNMPGYSFVSNHRKSKIGGGTGLYLENNLQYKICSECTYSNPDVIESLFVEINVPHGKNIVVGVIYRLPNQNTAVFNDELNDILINITRGNKLCYIMGDF